VVRGHTGAIEDVYESGVLQPPWNCEMEAQGEPPESEMGVLCSISPGIDVLASSQGITVVFVTDI
jgi:hypothetical protein